MVGFMKPTFVPKVCAMFLSAALFAGCSTVTVKKPAGDKVVALDAKVWEGKWLGVDDFRCVSRIKDPAQGLLEIRGSSPGEKEDVTLLAIRELKDRAVATV